MKYFWNLWGRAITFNDDSLILGDRNRLTLGDHDYFPFNDHDGRAAVLVNLGDELCAAYLDFQAWCSQQVRGFRRGERLHDVVGLADLLAQDNFVIGPIAPRMRYLQRHDGAGGQGYDATVKKGHLGAGFCASTKDIPFLESCAGRKRLPLLPPGRSPTHFIAGGRHNSLPGHDASGPQLVSNAGDDQEYNQGGGRRPTLVQETRPEALAAPAFFATIWAVSAQGGLPGGGRWGFPGVASHHRQGVPQPVGRRLAGRAAGRQVRLHADQVGRR